MSEIAWWNIYLTQTDAGSTPLHELEALAGSALLFRFNRDSDRDGYQDRVELRYGTDKDDPASHPKPEILAGYVASRIGDEVTVLLKLANSGSFDAYGIDAVMYAPDDTVTIGNNTVGGNGRVRPNQQVAVGSLVLPPELDSWTNSTAKPYAGGNYSGDIDKLFTFSVDTGGTVGQGSTALSWSDDDGGSGSLDLGSSYHAPLPLEVADGLQLGFDTGTISNGASFTVAALTPRDTFTYTVESEPFTPPVIVVSYSDPQGSHRFVTPVELDSLADDLIVHSGQMLPDVNVSIVTTAEVDPMNTNDTNFIINSPHPEPIVDANLYLNFVADGNLVEEITQTMTLQPGPTVIPVQWSTDTFSETYDIEADNILIAFWTDAQNNIIDSAARPLSTFQKDPTAKSAISETEWDFGSLVQGEIVEKEITLANIGFAKLWDIATVNGEGLSVTPNNTNRVFPATSQKIKVVLDTAELPAGPYSGQIIIKSSDVVSPQTIINLTGTILPLSGNVLANDVSDYLPWDQTVFITGTFNLNDIVTFSHNIPDEPPNIHPLYVYEEQSGNLLGVGEYGIDFTGEAGTSVDFGDGSAGDLIVNSGETFNINSIRTPLDGIADSGQNIIPVIDVTNFNAGDEILVIQAHGSGAGNYEFKKIVSINDNNLILNKPLQHSYESRLPIATVYREPNFTGIFEVITHNDNNVFNNPIDNDTISSIQVSSGTTVILYQNRDYGGTYETFTQDDPNLSDNLIGDNTTTSVRVFSTQKAQVIRVPNYQNVTVNAGGVLDTLAWNSTTHEGGILVFRANGIVQIDDDINVDWNGHPRGDRGHYGNFIKSHGWQGQSISLEGIQSINANHGGGGGAQGDDDSRDVGAGGGGGGYGTVGQSGQEAGSSSISLPGQGGNTYGSEDLTDAIHFGSGGGGGGADNMVANTGGYGGNGGGIIIIAANEFNTNNHITSNGNNGTNGFSGGNTGGGGGGSGGSILIIGSKVSLGNELVTSLGGAGGQAGLNGGVGGAGGEGRIHVQYCDEISGSTNPPAYEEQIQCNIIYQLPGNPNTELILPEDIDGYARYHIQYGQKQIFTASGTQIFTITIPKQQYESFSLDALFQDLENSNFNFNLDVGADGSSEWVNNGTEQPVLLTSPNLAVGLNTYLDNTPETWGEEVTVPISITVDTTGVVFLTNITLTSGANSDPSISINDLSVSDNTPTETDLITVTTSIHNEGHSTAENVIVSFFAGDPEDNGIYVGSDFIPTITTENIEQASVIWNTEGYSGTLEIYAVIDIAEQLPELDENNNSAMISVNVLSRPDLQVTNIDYESPPRLDVSQNIVLTVTNNGNSPAGLQNINLYAGDPNNGGDLIGSQSIAVGAATAVDVTITWTPATLGSITLYAQADSADDVSEFDESNNIFTHNSYVGWGVPVYIDVGGSGDQAYASETGYGFLTSGTVVNSCGAEPHATYRQELSSNALQYQFDYLLPKRFYHLDMTFYLCGGSRDLRVLVDGVEFANPVVANGEVNHLSLLLDPSLYTDNSIVVSIEKVGGGLGGPVVSEITLTDVRYCYRDSGAAGEIPYVNSPDDCGWLPGSIPDSSWGPLAHQTVRYAELAPVQYQADLEPGKPYQLGVTLYEEDGYGRIEDILIDGITVLDDILLSNAPQTIYVTIPPDTYADGTAVVNITEAFQPVISEIVFTEQTFANDTLYINVDNDDVEISWPGNAQLCSYAVHGETTPYFLLQANNWLQTIDDGSSSFLDTGSGTDGQNHYYKLLLEACDQSYTVRTGEIGKFSFDVVPGE